ncbi:hypothetical protein BASA62_004475 [Batrachochytrium salamandrivorans]|nr:hypothetical protein BASA62_004475 [Batrachochytrium salamandrivorans]
MDEDSTDPVGMEGLLDQVPQTSSIPDTSLLESAEQPSIPIVDMDLVSTPTVNPITQTHSAQSNEQPTLQSNAINHIDPTEPSVHEASIELPLQDKSMEPAVVEDLFNTPGHLVVEQVDHDVVEGPAAPSMSPSESNTQGHSPLPARSSSPSDSAANSLLSSGISLDPVKLPSTSPKVAPSPAPLHVSAPPPEPLLRLLSLTRLSSEAYFVPLFQLLHNTPYLGEFVLKLDDILAPKSLESASPAALLATIERMKAQELIVETEFEQRAHDSERELRTMASQLTKINEQTEQDRLSNVSNATLVSSLRQEIRQKDAELGSWHEKDLANQSLIQSLSSEKKVLTNQILKKHEDIVRLTENSESAQQSAAKLRDELHVSLAKVGELQSAQVEQRLSSSSLEQQIEQLQKSNTWLDDELKRRTFQLSEYRREKTDQLSSLQSKVEVLSQEKCGLEASNSSAQSWGMELEQKLHSATEKYKEADSRILLLEQQFKNEMSSQKRLTELYLNKSQELADQNSELDLLLRQTEAGIEQLQEDHRSIEESLRNELDQSNQSVEKLQEELKSTLKQLESVHDNPFISNSPDPMSHLSSTATALSKAQKSGKSMTEIITEYHDMKTQLVRSQHEEERLKEMVQHIMTELEERAPVLHQNKIDLVHANEELERISSELATALQQRTQATNEVNIINADKNALQQENILLQQESRDLGSQVQALLRQSEQSKNGLGGADALHSLPYNRSVTSTHASNGVKYSEMAADDIISERLVVFKNIEELQSQNQTLLRTVRSLTLKLEAYDVERARERDEWQTHELEEAANMIKAMQEQLAHQTNMIQSFVNERDSWRSIAERRGAASPNGAKEPTVRVSSPFRSSDNHASTTMASEYEQLYRSTQSEFAIFRKEAGVDTKELKSQIESLLQERTELSIQVAKLNNQHQYSQERDSFINKKLQYQEEESAQLRQRLQTLSDLSSRHDAKTQELTDGLMNARMSLESLQSENQQLKIERGVWKSSETRAVRDAQDLTRERNSANDRLRDLQHELDERVRVVASERAKAEDRLESLNRDIQLVRKQLADTLDDNRTLNAQKDSEQKEAHIKIERLTAQIEKLRGELLLAQHKEESLASKTQDLSSRLIVAEERVALYEGRSKTNSTLGANATDLDKIRDLDTKLTQTKLQLEAVKAELVVEKERCATLQGISQANEERLAEMNGTYEIFRADMDTNLAKKQSDVDALEVEIVNLKAQLETAWLDHGQTRHQLEESQTAHEAERAGLMLKMDHLRCSEEQAIASQAEMQADVSKHIAAARIAQENYEREVVAHSNAIQAVLAVKQSNREIYERAGEAESQLAASLAKLETVVTFSEATRSKLEEQISEYSKRIEDLSQQNELLHTQFEQISSSKGRSGREFNSDILDGAEVSTHTSADDQKRIDDLCEVIRFLRREKSILDTRLEISVQESERLTLQVDHIQRSLDETRAVLEEERKSSQDSLGTEEKHKALIEKIEQANLLRESNTTLRDQVEQTLKRLKRTEARLVEVEAQLEPLRAHSNELEAEVEARKAENSKLAEDNERWKGRTQQILQKYERIDPVEHAKLVEDVVTLAAARDKALQDLGELQASVDSQTQLHQSQIAVLENSLAQARTEIAQCREELAQKDTAMIEVKNRASKDADDANVKLKEIVMRSNSIAQKLKESKDRITVEYRQTQLKLQETEKSLAERVSAISATHMAELETQVGLQKSLEAKWEAKQLELQGELERNRIEIAGLRQRAAASSASISNSKQTRPIPSTTTVVPVVVPVPVTVVAPVSVPVSATVAATGTATTAMTPAVTPLVPVGTTLPSQALSTPTITPVVTPAASATVVPAPIKRSRDDIPESAVADPATIQEVSTAKRAKVIDTALPASNNDLSDVIITDNLAADAITPSSVIPVSAASIAPTEPTASTALLQPPKRVAPTTTENALPDVSAVAVSVTKVPDTTPVIAASVQSTTIEPHNVVQVATSCIASSPLKADIQIQQKATDETMVKDTPYQASTLSDAVTIQAGVSTTAPSSVSVTPRSTVAMPFVATPATTVVESSTSQSPMMPDLVVSAVPTAPPASSSVPVSISASKTPPEPATKPSTLTTTSDAHTEKELHAETQRIKKMLIMGMKKKAVKDQSQPQSAVAATSATSLAVPGSVGVIPMGAAVTPPRGITSTLTTATPPADSHTLATPTPAGRGKRITRTSTDSPVPLRARVARATTTQPDGSPSDTPPPLAGRGLGRGRGGPRGRGRGRGTPVATSTAAGVATLPSVPGSTSTPDKATSVPPAAPTGQN